MVRTYVRKSSNKSWSQEKMNEAVQKVRSGEMTLRRAADFYEVPYTTLQRRVAFTGSVIKHPGGQPVMDIAAEIKLADRLIYLANRGFGITPKNVRKYAFEFAVRHNLKHNFNTEAKMAGEDWFHRFRLRNKNVTIRKPEGLSRARINGMQKEKVTDFYKVLEKVIDDNNLRGKPECIYNQDETGLPLNNRASNIVAQKGSRDVVSMTSVERGQNVTVLACMNAAGHFIPPFVIFRGMRKRDDFMLGMPPGTEIFMTEKGWVTETAFKEWLAHFNRHRTQGKVILILDGHLSHTNLAVVDLCEDSDIELILIPPHTSHALQPLDVSFFKPLKAYYHQQATSWQHCNVGKGITKTVFGGLLKHAWNLSASVGNAAKGFEKTGIYPLNPHAIPPHKFVSSFTSVDNVHISSVEKPSTSGYQTNITTNSQPLTTNEDDAVAETIRDILPSPRKQTPAKKANVAKKPILHLTSSEHRSHVLKKIQEKVGKENKSKNKSVKGSYIKSSKRGKATPGIRIKGRSNLSREWHCIYCAEKFVHPPVEDWIQCSKCEEWCHENCADRKGEKGLFFCELCVK